MKVLLLLCTLVAGCIRLPHVQPEPRSPDDAARAVVRVDVSCYTPNPFVSGEPGDPAQFEPGVEWYPPATGTGVVISEQHVLTAAHVVRCPTIPTVRVTFPDGSWWTVDVERDDAMFGSGTDVARLEIASADHFHLGIAPPKLASGQDDEPISEGNGASAVAYVLGRDPERGTFTGVARGINMHTQPGDSGAPIYNIWGQLVGLVSKGSEADHHTIYVPVTSTWLEGT